MADHEVYTSCWEKMCAHFKTNNVNKDLLLKTTLDANSELKISSTYFFMSDAQKSCWLECYIWEKLAPSVTFPGDTTPLERLANEQKGPKQCGTKKEDWLTVERMNFEDQYLLLHGPIKFLELLQYAQSPVITHIPKDPTTNEEAEEKLIDNAFASLSELTPVEGTDFDVVLREMLPFVSHPNYARRFGELRTSSICTWCCVRSLMMLGITYVANTRHPSEDCEACRGIYPRCVQLQKRRRPGKFGLRLVEIERDA